MSHNLQDHHASGSSRILTVQADGIHIRKSGLQRISLVLVILAAGGLAAYLIWTGVDSSVGAHETPIQGPLPTLQPGDPGAIAAGHNPAIGPDDARVTLVEFSDFYCIYCKAFHDETLSTLLAKYNGKLRFVYRDFPALGGQRAAEAASCANEQGAYWAYHNALFSDPHAYGSSDQFTALAQALNLNGQQFRECISSGKFRDQVLQDYQAGLSFGVRGTPTFFINGIRLIGAQPLSAFEQIIDQQLQG